VCVCWSLSLVYLREKERKESEGRGSDAVGRRNKQLFTFFDFQMSNVK